MIISNTQHRLLKMKPTPYFQSLLIIFALLFANQTLAALEPAKRAVAKPAVKAISSAIPKRQQWLKVNMQYSAANLIEAEYKQQLIVMLGEDAEYRIALLTKALAKPEEIRAVEDARDARIKDITSILKTSPVLSFESKQGGTWKFFRDSENSIPTRLQKISIPAAKNYTINAWVYCSEKTKACTNLIEATNTMKPLLPRVLMGNTELYSDWLRIARAEPCDAALPITTPGPQYPAAAQRDSISGTVVLQFNFNACGDVLNAWVVKSSRHPILDASALKAVSRWRVNTANLSTSLVSEGRAQVPIKFAIEE
jgi:TonB family protein